MFTASQLLMDFQAYLIIQSINFHSPIQYLKHLNILKQLIHHTAHFLIVLQIKMDQKLILIKTLLLIQKQENFKFQII